MPGLINDIAELLNTQGGNLAYHLVISFAILGALAITLPHYLEEKTTGNRRVLIGIILLLGIRFINLFLIGLFTQIPLNYSAYLPEISRTVDFLTVLVFFYIWIFSYSKYTKKTYSLFSSLSIIFFGILLVFLWISYSSPISLGAKFYLALCNLATVLLLYTGITLLNLRRPRNWKLGLIIFSALIIGELGQVFIFSNQDNIPIFVRLMQLSAFPLLFGISYDKNLSFEKNKTETSFIGEKGMKYQNLKPNHDDKITEIIINRGNLLEAVINLTNVDNNDSPENSLVKIISHSFIADIVLLISPPNKQKKSLILSGYDLISENYIYINEFEEVQISGLKKSFLSNSPIYINSYDPSLSTISKVINVEDLGNSVIIPINKEPLSPEFCILLAYPYTNQTINDFAVESIQKSRQEIINHSQQKTIAKKSELDKLELQSNEFEERASRFENENKLLLDEISSYQNVSNNNFNEELEMAKDTIEKLKVENEELSNNIEMVLLKEKERAEKDRKQKTEEVDSSPSISVFIKEAHNYIEELLNFYYSENIKNDGDGKQLSTNFSKSNSDELDDLLKSLYFISSVSSKDKEFNPDYFDLSEIVDKTINYFGEELRNKDITLRVDFHSELPKIYSDEEIIYEVVTNFLKNAVNACLYGGEILIKATIIQDQNSICLDIRDSGVGIEEKEIPLFFSISRSEKGISFSEDEKSELNLPVSKLLLEQLGGEVKIGSKIGKGTTFGLIIPISISQEKNNRTAK